MPGRSVTVTYSSKSSVMRSSIARVPRSADSVLARLEQLERDVAELQARFAPGDAADVAVLVAIVEARVPQPFTSGAIVAAARGNEAVAAALEAADVVNVYQLGKLLSRLRWRTIDGFAVERDDTTQRWRIVPRT